MSKITKIWLIVAASLVLAGAIIFTGVMCMLNWDFTKLSTVEYETKTYEIGEEYKDIQISDNTADITFVPSEGNKTSIVCQEQKNTKYSVTVKDGKLVIELIDQRKWYEHIGINFGSPKLTVYISEGEYGALSIKSSTSNMRIPKDFKFESIDISVTTGDVTIYAAASDSIKIKTTTGKINVENLSAKSLDLSVTTGDVTVSSVKCEGDVKIKISTGRTSLIDLKCQNLTSSGITGDISMKNTVAEGSFSIERDTGDVRFDGCDAAEITVKTNTGDIRGTLLTDKIFIAKSDTGRVSTPETQSGGKCKLTTDTGDIIVSIK